MQHQTSDWHKMKEDTIPRTHNTTTQQDSFITPRNTCKMITTVMTRKKTTQNKSTSHLSFSNCGLSAHGNQSNTRNRTTQKARTSAHNWQTKKEAHKPKQKKLDRNTHTHCKWQSRTKHPPQAPRNTRLRSRECKRRNVDFFKRNNPISSGAAQRKHGRRRRSTIPCSS